MPPSRKPYGSAQDRENRRLRIMAALQAGYSYEAIARDEGVTRERIRQIVSESVRVGNDERIDLPRVQMARLEPALRLAAGAISKGEIAAVPALLKILTQIDKYGAAFSPVADGDRENIRARLLAKFNRMAARIKTEPEAKGDDAQEVEKEEDGEEDLELADEAENAAQPFENP